jgi:hypothetical protein
MMSPRSEDGFGLIHVLVLMGVISLSAALYFQARSQSMRAARIIDSSKSVLDLNGALTAELTALVRTVQPSAPGCLDLAAEANGRALTKTFGTSKLTYTQDVLNAQWLPSGLEATEKNRLTAAMNESPLLRAPAQRCRRPRLPQSSNNPAANTFYFCLNASQDSTAPAGSFLNSRFAFIEVGWNLINLHTGAPLSCENFATLGGAAGAQIFYTVYWATSMGPDDSFKKYTNTVTVGK